jgi:hypothetical protein
MGIRSDVAVALKKNVWDNLTAESKSTLDDWFQEPASETQEGHVLFYDERIKWYQSYDDLAQLYAELTGVFDDEDYLIVQACHDYPESDEGNLGGWYENPWEIYKNWSVSLEWDEPQASLHRPQPGLPTPNREEA